MNTTKYLLLFFSLILNLLYGNDITTKFMTECGLEQAYCITPPTEEALDLICRASVIIDETVKAYYDKKISITHAIGRVVLARIAQEICIQGDCYLDNDLSETRASVLLGFAHSKLPLKRTTIFGDEDLPKTNPTDFYERGAYNDLMKYYIGFTCGYAESAWFDILYHKAHSTKNASRKLKKLADITPIAIKSLFITATFKSMTLQQLPSDIQETMDQLIIEHDNPIMEQIKAVAKYIKNMSVYEFNFLRWTLDDTCMLSELGYKFYQMKLKTHEH